MKYSYEDKLRFVKEYIKTGCIPKCSGVNRYTFGSQLRLWKRMYLKHGKESLKHTKHKHFTEKTKLEVIKKLYNGYSKKELSVELGISHSVILCWKRKYESKGFKGLKCESGRPLKKKHKIVPKAINNDVKSVYKERLELLSAFEKPNLYKKVQLINQIRKEFNFSLSDILTASNIPSSSYYYNCNRQTFETKNIHLIKLVKLVFEKYKGIYGVNRIKTALASDYGLIMNKKKIRKIMRLEKLKVKTFKGKYKSYKGKTGIVCKNLIHRDFTSYKPLKKITTDVTEFDFDFGKVYLQPYLDMFNCEILCYQISDNVEFKETRMLLTKLISKYKNKLNKTIFHSDQGWQYQTEWYHNKIKNLGCFQSMSNKGNCLDNAIMENFFGRLKMEIYYGKKYNYKSYTEFKNALIEYIKFYNNKRIKTKFGMSPVQYRLSINNN